MLIIVDNKIPQIAKDKLSAMGDLCLFYSENIVYREMSGHTDIFIFQKDNQIIIAPQTPKHIVSKLLEHRIDYKVGNSELGNKYPKTAAYNVSTGDGMIIGNSKTCDSSITELCKNSKWIHSPQSYARCNTIILNKDHIITSEITVKKAIPKSLYVNSKQIVLEGFSNGFFGGCAGIHNNKIYIVGSLKYHSQKSEIESYCKKAAYEIIELYDGPLIDIGGIFFL